MQRRQFHRLAAAGLAMYIKPATAATRSQRFYLPEEAGPHLRTFMQWPVSRRVYGSGSFLDSQQTTIADIANRIADFEPVVMLMAKEHHIAARKKLSKAVEIWDIATEDLWARDSGPVFVRNSTGQQAVSHLNFNGWGNKQVHAKDGKIAAEVARRLGLELLDNGLVGEGGGVESDGLGTLIAHSSSWVNPNRNPQPRQKIEEMLLEALGAEKIIWAPGIIGGDITDYHIDALARFVAPGHIVMQLPDEVYPGDPWSKAAYETYDILRNATDARGKSFKISRLPEPKAPRITSADFVASYVNYYICNNAVIASQFGDEQTDEETCNSLKTLYPDRDIIMLNTDPLGQTGGGIHCATQQQPV